MRAAIPALVATGACLAVAAGIALRGDDGPHVPGAPTLLRVAVELDQRTQAVPPGVPYRPTFGAAPTVGAPAFVVSGPVSVQLGYRLVWPSVAGAARYRIWLDGRELDTFPADPGVRQARVVPLWCVSTARVRVLNVQAINAAGESGPKGRPVSRTVPPC